jgi:hypothetical protein
VSLHIGVLAYVIEVFILDLFEQLFASGISNEKSFGNSASLQSYFSCIFKVANQEISLYYCLNAFVPISVARDRLSHHHKLRFFGLGNFLLLLFFLSIIVGSVGIFGSKLIKEIGSTLCSHGLELLLLCLLRLLWCRSLLLLRFEELAAEDPFYFLDNLDFIIAK